MICKICKHKKEFQEFHRERDKTNVAVVIIYFLFISPHAAILKVFVEGTKDR